jgi:hypothetical protein
MRFYQIEIAEKVKTRMGVSPLMAIAEKVAEIVNASGRSGISTRQVGRVFFQFRNLEKMEREMVLYRLKTDHNIVELPVKPKGAGRPTDRLFHNDFAPEKKSRRED